MVVHFRMAEALAIQKTLGEHGSRWIAERIGALALAGDRAGVERFERIAECYQTLIGPLSALSGGRDDP